MLSIGVGRNLEDNGLRDSEIEFMLDNDIDGVEGELMAQDWARGHGFVRWCVLLNMCFNLGLPRLSRFTRMIAALRRRDYTEASREMLDSRWATQVGPRAMELSRAMKEGAFA